MEAMTVKTIWTMEDNNGNFVQTGLVAHDVTYYGGAGTGYPVYFAAGQNPNGSDPYWEVDGTVGSAQNTTHQYIAGWKYQTDPSDPSKGDYMYGTVDGHLAGAHYTKSWPIPNQIENFMEESSYTITDPGYGFGSSSNNENIWAPSYYTTGGSSVAVTSGTTTVEGSYEWLSGSANDFYLWDSRNK
jgi:hypothetical protein